MKKIAVKCAPCHGDGKRREGYLYMGHPKVKMGVGPCQYCAGTGSVTVTLAKYYATMANKPRHRRHELREIASRRQGQFRQPDRYRLMLVIASRRGYRNLGDFAAAQYRRGKVSETLYSLMTRSDFARMQYVLGFSAMQGGRLIPELTALCTR